MNTVQIEMEETKNRYFAFVEKLEERMKQFADEALPELIEMNTTDSDESKRNYLSLKSAIEGQLKSILQKANEIMDEKVSYFREATNSNTLLYDFRRECYNRLSVLDNLYHYYLTKIKATDYEDYEIPYQKIIAEFNEIKNKFKCVQCSSPIEIDKMYFTNTYITCSSCQTQNTYEPSSLAKQLEVLGRSLAEQRTAHLLKEYYKNHKKDQELYFQKHQLEVSLMFENDKQIIAEKTAQIDEIEKQRKAITAKQPILYQIYLRAMFDQWNSINPAMQVEHEKFYIRLLEENQKIY